MRLTNKRQEEILASLVTVAATLRTVAAETRTPDHTKPGNDAQMLYPVVEWMAPIVEEVLYEHVRTVESPLPLVWRRLSWWRKFRFWVRRETYTPAHRFTERRKAGILEHLATLVRLYRTPDVEGHYALDLETMRAGPSDAQRLWAAWAWMVPILEELLVEHAITAVSTDPADAAPTLSMRDRFRGMAGGAFGRATSGGAPGEKGA